jgi:hypothetical protein
MEYLHWLVVLTILKNMKVNGKDYPIYEMENKKCLKPPTSTGTRFNGRSTFFHGVSMKNLQVEWIDFSKQHADFSEKHT